MTRAALLVAAGALVAAPITAYAGDSFSDVPDSNIFHDDIDWMAENGVTQGCGGDRFCPDGVVTREQMSAFMRRLDSQDVFTTPDEVDAAIDAAAIGGGPSGPIDADTLDGLNSTQFLRTTGTAADAQLLDGRDSTEFAGRLWAVVDADGTLVRGNGAVSSALNDDPGGYEVIFDRDVTGCAFIATLGAPDDGLPPIGGLSVSNRSGTANGAYVDTYDSDGAYANGSFHIWAVC